MEILSIFLLVFSSFLEFSLIFMPYHRWSIFFFYLAVLSRCRYIIIQIKQQAVICSDAGKKMTKYTEVVGSEMQVMTFICNYIRIYGNIICMLLHILR